ncbi:MAG: hypothetical protein HS101_18545 [Planctomycetia bacterium]|nr:hypothetical protein [Planctomycetia bacterium]
MWNWLRTIFCASILLMLVTNHSAGSPILLAIYHQDWPGGPSGGPPTDRVEFPLAHLHAGEIFPFTIGESVSWIDNQPGSLDLNESNDSDFLEMAARLTDGQDEELFSMLIAGSSGVGSPQPESIQHGIAPDLFGNEIDFIRFIVDNITITPFVHPEFGQRVHVIASVSYEFWGTPVPEPTTLTLLFIIALLRRHRRVPFGRVLCTPFGLKGRH